MPVCVLAGWQQDHQNSYLKGFVVVRGLVMCERVKVTFMQSFFLPLVVFCILLMTKVIFINRCSFSFTKETSLQFHCIVLFIYLDNSDGKMKYDKNKHLELLHTDSTICVLNTHAATSIWSSFNVETMFRL